VRRVLTTRAEDSDWVRGRRSREGGRQGEEDEVVGQLFEKR